MMKHVRELPEFLAHFIRDPIHTMREPVKLTWPAVFFLQTGAAALSGAIVGIVEKSLLDVAAGVLIFPIASVATSLVLASFLYFFFSFYHSTYLDFKRLHTVVSLASIPYFLFHSISGLLSPIDLIGFACAGLLMVVGLVEQFQIERRHVLRVIIGLGVIFFIAWSLARYRAVMG
jgi:hypothetical protein